ncbi:SGNH/GDSL hydrolase family protein [Mangrovibacterium sp.]|uniref:SGNH/GDSL hydrolase family protein n=1 Tax=Mangrovibacterium sp. TaxID=1961364 RepID=UPI00356900C7
MKLFVFQIAILFILATVTNVEAQVINAGIGGNNTVNLLARLDSDVLTKQPDLVILMVGTNDMLNSNKMITYSDYTENLTLIVEKIQATGAKVLLMCPPPVDSVYLFQRHERSLFAEAPNVKMDTVCQIVQRIAGQSGSFCINLFQEFNKMNLPRHNEDLFFRNPMNCGKPDGVHPTALGYRFIGELVFRYLKTNNLLSENLKIVCFGDSITFGSGAKGGGTVAGENYPSVLSALIK